MKPKVSWKKGAKPSAVLEKIGKARTVGADGSVSFSGMEFHEWAAVVETKLQFPNEPAIAQQNRIVFQAMFHCPKLITPESFLGEVNAQYAKLSATRFRDFKFLTSISLKDEFVKPVWLDDRVNWEQIGGFYPKKFATREQAIHGASLPIDCDSGNYTKLILSVRAKSAHQAAQIALDTIDLNRGFWCMVSNPSMTWFSTALQPINTVRLGGAHTVHHADGKTEEDCLWFEPNFLRMGFLHTLSAPASASAAKLAERVTRSNYSAVLQQSLLRYVRALDERDHSNSLFKLWGAVECLASPNEARYDLIVKRCSFFFRDRAYHEQVLEHLRERRNRFIHAASEGENTLVCCHQLQYYFCKLFYFHAQHHDLFQSLEDANLFLDQSHDLPSLEKRLEILGEVKKYITPKRTPSI